MSGRIIQVSSSDLVYRKPDLQDGTGQQASAPGKGKSTASCRREGELSRFGKTGLAV